MKSKEQSRGELSSFGGSLNGKSASPPKQDGGASTLIAQRLLGRSASPLELRESQVQLKELQGSADCAVLELDPTFNARHSNSEGLPDIDRESQNPGGTGARVSVREQDHYDFLNSLKQNLKVDPSKLIDLENRMSGLERDTISQNMAISDTQKRQGGPMRPQAVSNSSPFAQIAEFQAQVSCRKTCEAFAHYFFLPH
ncbi:hypothetical protein FGO68_gene3699 [Halteria grandinella]|uniref:Uncharacterized protein n=1 Tax=Halteria grandinella TaxID=5974 RepID=A0A8J8NFU1_HALGN|nr:hypothetical protein FGO68_gene3699 [Halteria grandinella]